MPSARRVHSFTSSPAHFTFEVGGVHTIFPGSGELSLAQETPAITIADDHNAFALTLLAALTRHRGNLFYSPLSVRAALFLGRVLDPTRALSVEIAWVL